MTVIDLRARLHTEYQRRVARNRRYSVRAFARALRTHHWTLTEILERRRRLTARTIRHLGAQLGLSADEIAEACLQEHADALWEVLGSPHARIDSRWLATQLGIPLDDINRALQRLIWQRRLRITAPDTWIREAP